MMIEIWGRKGCWFCDAAKRLCQTKNIDFNIDNIVADNYKITKDQKIGIIPPIGGG